MQMAEMPASARGSHAGMRTRQVRRRHCAHRTATSVSSPLHRQKCCSRGKISGGEGGSSQVQLEGTRKFPRTTRDGVDVSEQSIILHRVTLTYTTFLRSRIEL